MKERMSYAEMEAAYLATNPIYEANVIRVGKFAKQMGYVKKRQVIKHKQIYFYVKSNG